jgi:phage terminase small subunit
LRKNNFVVDKSGSMCYKGATLPKAGEAIATHDHRPARSAAQLEPGSSTLNTSPGGRSALRSARAKRRATAVEGAAQDASPSAPLDEIAERAARLGVTPERVLQEYARIAFADLGKLADWGPDGLVLKAPERLGDADTAVISEITGAPGNKNYRVKLYDKKAALDVLARHLGMLDGVPRRPEPAAPDDPEEDPREVLKRRLARLAAAGADEQTGRWAEPVPGEKADR